MAAVELPEGAAPLTCIAPCCAACAVLQHPPNHPATHFHSTLLPQVLKNDFIKYSSARDDEALEDGEETGWKVGGRWRCPPVARTGQAASSADAGLLRIVPQGSHRQASCPACCATG